MTDFANHKHYTAKEKKKRQQKLNRELARAIVYSNPGAAAYRLLWKRGDYPFRRSPFYQVDSPQVEAAKELWRARYRWKLGSRVALLDAFEICKDHRWPYPNWLNLAVEDLMSKALFFGGVFKAENPRVGQQELTRLQMQKHCQMYYGIKLRQSDSQGDERVTRLLSPVELRQVTDEKLEAATTDGKRYSLASSLLPRATKGQRTNSAVAIEDNLKKLRDEVSEKFGVGQVFSADPECYLWDLPFLRTETMKKLNLPYLQ